MRIPGADLRNCEPLMGTSDDGVIKDNGMFRQPERPHPSMGVSSSDTGFAGELLAEIVKTSIVLSIHVAADAVSE
jgi:hypothetical protein